jgi:ABC-type nitrate/sulfonate/bicarbonate transport system substrate-binding protein
MRLGPAVLAAALAAALCGAAQAETVLRYGQIPSTLHSVSSLHLFIAEGKRFFAREGVRLDRIPIDGGTDKMVAALMAGKIDLTQTATPYLIRAVLGGSDAVAIAGEAANPIYSLIVKPEIEAFADLKGRLIGLSLAVDTISLSTRKLLALKGLKDGDYRVKELVGTPVRFDCLKRGECDAVPLGQPEDFRAIGEGYRRLGLTTEAVAAFQFQVTAVRRPWGAAHKEAVAGFVRALAAAFRFIRDPKNRDEVVATIVTTTGSSEAIARDTLKLYFEPDRGVLPKAAEIDLKGFAQVIAFMGEAKAIPQPLPKVERFVDLTYLHLAGVR